ncbi:hypothetical protein ACLB2K_064002 [Fragaria x ananassa]
MGDKVDNIARIALSNGGGEDRMVWHFDNKGLYSVKNGYHVARMTNQLENIASTLDSNMGTKALYMKIWGSNAPPKVRMHAWRLVRGILPTQCALNKRVQLPDVRRVFCGFNGEDDKHMFMRCRLIQCFWEQGPLYCKVRESWNVEEVIEWVAVMLEKLTKEQAERFLMALWVIWDTRNDVLWNGGLYDLGPLQVEAEALRAGILISIHEGREMVEIKSDCSTLVHALHRDEDDLSMLGRIVKGSTANLRLRSNLVWWRKWARKDWAIATVAFTVILFLFLTLISNSSDSGVTNPSHPITSADLVDLTLLHDAERRGALCLDGSAPGYHFRKGFGSGAENWLLHIEGGGWCNTMKSCSLRKWTPLGSSKYMDHRVPFSGILSSHSSENPDFFNWNKVKIRYCDGASFAGHPANEPKNGSKLFFRGQLIWEALMDEFSSIGLSKAKQALLSGCSAGGLATLIHCDDFRGLLPRDSTVKCLADAGFFLDEKDVNQNRTMRNFYRDVVVLQDVAKSLHKDCVANKEPAKCLFPEEIIKHVSTPLFLVNPAYDFWQIQHILIPEASDPYGYWKRCKLNIHNCNPSQIEILQGFRRSMLNALSEFQKNKEGGMFINSCFIHCQTWFTETWHSPSSPRINNKTIAESMGDCKPGNSTSEDLEDNNSYITLALKALGTICAAWILQIFKPLDPVWLGGASIIHMLLDPLFLYVPLINEDIKCVMVDNRLKIAALVLRSVSDLRYQVRIIVRTKQDGKRDFQSLKKIAKSTAVDTVSHLPIPQVVVLSFLPNMRVGSLKIMKFLNSLIVLQYLARASPMWT